jgi:hypothetical protein
LQNLNYVRRYINNHFLQTKPSHKSWVMIVIDHDVAIWMAIASLNQDFDWCAAPAGIPASCGPADEWVWHQLPIRVWKMLVV